MSNTITLTLDLDAKNLKKNSRLLAQLAEFCTDEKSPTDKNEALLSTLNDLKTSAEQKIATNTNTTIPTAPTDDAKTLIPEQPGPGADLVNFNDPVSTTNDELDTESLPWDARIHAPSRVKLKKDGTWKLRRNIDPSFVKKVKDELKAVAGSRTTSAADELVSDITNVEIAPPLPPVETSKSVNLPPPPLATEPEIEINYANLVNRIMAGFQAKTFTKLDIEEALLVAGVEQITDLKSPENHEAVHSVWQHIDNLVSKN